MKRKKTSIIAQSLKSTNQCVTATKSANKTLGMISRTSVNKDTHIEMLEKVQKRAIQLMFRDRRLSYDERLQKSGLTTLETRRLRGDLIEMFKISKVLMT